MTQDITTPSASWLDIQTTESHSRCLARTAVSEDCRGIGHAGVQEELVHVIAGIVVLRNVAAGAKQGVGSCGMRQPQQAIPRPVQQAQSTPGGLNVDHVGSEQRQQCSQVVHLKSTP